MDNQNNGKTIQKLSDEELEATSGGSFIDDVVCFVAGHNWEKQVEKGTTNSELRVAYYRCSNCGKKRYTRYTFSNWTISGEKEISESEYNAY